VLGICTVCCSMRGRMKEAKRAFQSIIDGEYYILPYAIKRSTKVGVRRFSLFCNKFAYCLRVLSCHGVRLST
jgi:hypothetical protein